ENESKARLFSNYLVVKGIPNQIEADGDGSWIIWIHNEDELKHARELLLKFQANPNDPEVRSTAEKAKEVIEKEKEANEAAAKRFFTRNQVFRNRGFMGMGGVTLALVALSVVGFLLVSMKDKNEMARHILSFLFMSLDETSNELPEIKSGQVWRLITPI